MATRSRKQALAAPSGWRPSPFDGRDLAFRADGLPPVPPGARHLLAHPFPPREQRDVPCCVSSAVCVAMEVLDAAAPPAVPLSALFHYFASRADPRRLGLVDLRTALDVAAGTGVCSQALHRAPMTPDGAATRPSPEAFADAERRRLVGFDPGLRRMQYEALDGAASWRAALSAGFPVVLGLWLTSAYAALTAENPVHGPPPPEPASAGHGVAVIGFDDGVAGGAFLVKDSRGRRFAREGTWWLPYAAVESRLVHEAWVVRRITY